MAGARTSAPLRATPSGDIATAGISTVCTRIALLEWHLQAGEEKLKARERDLFGRLSTVDKRV